MNYVRTDTIGPSSERAQELQSYSEITIAPSIRVFKNWGRTRTQDRPFTITATTKLSVVNGTFLNQDLFKI